MTIARQPPKPDPLKALTKRVAAAEQRLEDFGKELIGVIGMIGEILDYIESKEGALPQAMQSKRQALANPSGQK